MIQVTKTHLPDVGKYQTYVESIFESGWITNNGSLVNELELKLKEYLEVPFIVLVSNGTLALQIAYKLLNIKGEVLTTPFSFVATTSSVMWDGLNPVYIDIDANTLNMNPELIQQAITKDTTCIVPVHVFGNPCEVEKIQSVAKEYGLKVIYDAAHAFGTKYKGKSVLNYGDVSTLSFHATKIFHTIEGGALILQDQEMYLKAKQLINFGFANNGIPNEVGINCKMNEFQAAMGLCMLDEMDLIISKRKAVFNAYMRRLTGIKSIEFQSFNNEATRNYSYFPILLDNQEMVLSIKEELEHHGILTRRYFYPSLDTLPFVQSEKMKESGTAAERILCLPMYDELSEDEIESICNIVINQYEASSV